MASTRNSRRRKCSDLRGSEQPAAFQEGIETSSPPGAKEGCQGRAGAAADLATGYQMAGSARRRCCLRARLDNEDKQWMNRSKSLA